jgi:hypothetical protein
MNEGWIKIYYKMLDWEWMDDPYVVALWVRILLNANQKEKKWHGLTVKRGQWITSVHHIAEQTGWSRNTIKRILRILEQSNQITIDTGSNGVIITVTNYGKYQNKGGSNNDLQGDPLADPLADQQGDLQGDPLADPNIRSIDSKKERKKENIIYTHNAREGDFKTYGTFNNVKLTDGDLEDLRIAFAGEGLPPDFLNRAIDKLSAYMAQEGRNYNNHRAAIMNWAKTAVLEDDRKTGKAQQRYQQQTQPSSMQLTENEKRQIWARLSDKDKQEYLDTHDGLTPWQYDEQHGTN